MSILARSTHFWPSGEPSFISPHWRRFSSMGWFLKGDSIICFLMVLSCARVMSNKARNMSLSRA
jgi:hypothetical protein